MAVHEQITKRKKKFDDTRAWLVEMHGGQDEGEAALVCLYLLVSDDAIPSPQEIAWATGLTEREVYPALHELIRASEAKYGPQSAGRIRGILRLRDFMQ
jgi:hypothetical protein